MARSLRRKKPLSSSEERTSDPPPISTCETDGENIAVPGYPGPPNVAQPSRPRPTSKAGIVLALLEAPEGATLSKLIAVTGWQAHTTRAALTGLRKRGFPVAIAKVPGAGGVTVSTYRIAAPEVLRWRALRTT